MPQHAPMETVLITGANRGIGLELTKRFLAAGNRVITTVRTTEPATELAGLAQPPDLTILQLEVTNGDSMDGLIGKLLSLIHI